VAGGMAGAGIMNSNRRLARRLDPYRPLDRAAVALGAVSILSAAFIFVHGTFQIVQIGAISLVVALVLGLLAMAAGWLAEATLIVAAGVGFLLAAGVQILLLAGGNAGFLGGNPSTFSLWLGLGVGLIAIGLVPRPELAAQDTFGPD
jgi:hypothetical protein